MLTPNGQDYKRRNKLADIFSTKAKSTKSTETKESYNMNKDILTLAASVVIVLFAAIIGITVYNINDRNNMAKNIEAAIAKGVDPLSVKCAYETSPNPICITYAATVRK
jgi:heme/copper-type cytochrome/quinol oxidase subunit 2